MPSQVKWPSAKKGCYMSFHSEPATKIQASMSTWQFEYTSTALPQYGSLPIILQSLGNLLCLP